MRDDSRAAPKTRKRGAEAVTVPTDVSSEADVERLADAAVQRFGGIDTPIHQHAANYTGRPVRPPPPVTDPVRVARAIVRVSRRPRRLTQVGRVQSLFVHARALAPAVYEAVVARVYPIIALKRGSVPPGPGNTFRPDRDATGITGGWRILPWLRHVPGHRGHVASPAP